MLDFALCSPWVDSPRIGRAEFLEDPFGGEGGEDFFALSPGGGRPNKCSLLSVAVTVMAFSWGCLDMKMGGGLLRLGRQRVLLCVVDVLFLRLVGRSSG